MSISLGFNLRENSDLNISSHFCLPSFFPFTWDMLVGLWLVPQWTDSGRSGALGAIARWPVPMALSRGPGSAQRLPMGDLSVAVTGQKAESAIILTAQVKILSLIILHPLRCFNFKLWFQIGRREKGKTAHPIVVVITHSHPPLSLLSTVHYTCSRISSSLLHTEKLCCKNQE